MSTPYTIEELKDYPFREVIRHNFEDEQLSFDAPVLGKSNTAIIPLAQNIMLAYFSGIPEAGYKMRYSHYYQDQILLSICMTGTVAHEVQEEPFVAVHAGETFMYEVNRDQTYFEVQAGKRFEMATIIIGRQEFSECMDRFFEKEQYAERQECIDAIFSGSRKGKVFDISREIKLIIRQILSCRLRNNYRRVFLECKLYEIMAYYLQSITEQPAQQIRFSQEDIRKLQEVKQLLSGQDQILQLSVAQLCKKVGLNRFKLNQGFQSLFNTSVIRFYNQSVLNKAYQDLLHSRESIERIAFQYGYGSLQAFSTAFFKEFNIRPSALRKRAKDGC